MSVVVAIEDVGPCRKQLKVEVPAPAVEAETRRVVDEYRRRARIPGFRKGKVPAALVRQRYEQDIDREVIDRLVPRYWRQAQAERELDVLLPPEVGDVDLVPGSGLTFTATVETRPAIEIGSLDDIELPEMEVEPGPDEVDAAIEDLRRQAADWTAVGRVAARGDRIRGRLRELTDEEPGEPQQVAFEVGDPQVWEELSLATTGAAAEREVEFSRRPQPDAPERRYRLLVEAVEERLLPDVDDELARKVGDFADLGELRAAATTRLREGKRTERRLRRESALLDELRGRHPLALPDGLVQQEIERALRAYAEQLAGRGVDLEQAEIDWQGLAERERPQVEKRVHAQLLLDALARRDGVEVTEADFERVLAQLARAEGRSTSAVRRALDESGRLGELRARLRREKLLRKLLGEDEPESGEDAGQAQEAGQE